MDATQLKVFHNVSKILLRSNVSNVLQSAASKARDNSRANKRRLTSSLSKGMGGSLISNLSGKGLNLYCQS